MTTLKAKQFKTLDGQMRWSVMSDDATDPVMMCDSEEEANAYIAKFSPGDAGKKNDRKNVQRVMRIDAGDTLRKPVKMDNGWLKVDGYLTRTGVFTYRNPDGSERKELRLPEDVFHKDSLETFSLLPITDDHPPKFLDSTNTNKYQRGQIGETVKRDGHLMRAAMMITDAALVKKIESGQVVEISNGYSCDLDEEPGTTADGEHYDAIQRNIRANHVAMVPAGRAGPEARVRMDGAAGGVVSISDVASAAAAKPVVPPGVRNVEKIKIDGLEYDAGSPQAAAAMVAYKAKLDAAEKLRADAAAAQVLANEKIAADLKTLKDLADKAQARADAAEEEKKKSDAELKAAPIRIAKELKARMALEATAVSILGSKAKLDGLTDLEVKALVLKKTNPDLKLDGKSEAHVDGRFEAAVEKFKEDREEDGGEGEDHQDGIDTARQVIHDDGGDVDEPGSLDAEMTEEEMNGTHKDSATAYQAMCQRGRSLWKQPIGPPPADA